MKPHRCHATIVFADLTSSTRIGESLDPEQVADVMGSVRQMAEDVISRYGGVVNQFYGDGVLAAFGFPDPQEDDVLRAIDATLELHEAVQSILPIPGIHLPDLTLQLHSGIHAGLVFVQEGDQIQGRYRISGDALNTAARLSDAAQPNELLVNANTIRSVLPFFNTEKVPLLYAKGKRLPLEAYKVLGRSSVRTRYGASLSRGLNRYVGREEELKLLYEDFADACRHGARYFEVTGIPGQGKTRLCEEFACQSQQLSATVCKAYCYSDNSDKPLYPFTQILRSLFGLSSGLSTAEAIVCIDGHLQDHFPDLVRFRPYLLRVLSLTETSQPREFGTQLLRHTIEAIVALIQAQARRQALVLFLDDWHQADDLSIKTLVTLLDQSSKLPLFVLTATRTELAEIQFFKGRSLQLAPLNQTECASLVARYFQHPLDDESLAAIFRRSGGNPLFIEELCQSSRWYSDNLNPNTSSNNLSVTLTSLISSRLNRLPEEIDTLVNTAAVLGTMFETRLLEAMLNTPLTESMLNGLVDYGVIYPDSSSGLLRFKHGITREVAYERMSLKQRKMLHRQASTLLEQQVAQAGGEEYFELLAYHYAGADEKLSAGKYSELAGDSALSTMALDRAANQYSRALEMLDPAVCIGSSYARWKNLLIKFGWISIFDPQPAQLQIFERGLQLAQQNQDQEGLAKFEHWLGYLHYALGNSTQAIVHCQNAIAAATSLHATPVLMASLAQLGQAKFSVGEYREALQLLDQVQDAKTKHKQNARPSVGSVYTLACKATALGDQGWFEQAYDCFESALNALQGDHQLKGAVLGLYSCVKLWQGDWQTGRLLAQNAQVVGQKISSSNMFTIYIGLAEYANWMMNGNETCLPRILTTIQSLEMRGNMMFMSLNYGWAAEILAQQGKWQSARKYAARALARARNQDRWGEAMAYRALTSLCLSVQSPHYKRYLNLAMQAAQARESRHELAKNQLHWARVLYQLKQPDQAEPYLEQALEGFRAMKMHWFEQEALQLVQNRAASA